MLINGDVLSFIGSIIVGLITMCGVIYSAKQTKETNQAVMKTQLENITNQIKALEVKQDRHNSVIERTYELEKTQAETSRDVKTLYNNLDEVKRDVKDVKGDVEALAKTVTDIKENEIRLEEQIK